ncbi:MAG: hypothetical protein M5U34_24335 [Chloroflexi bacterium]|nr:hypothetical protein [Chloroflexota bacterium]
MNKRRQGKCGGRRQGINAPPKKQRRVNPASPSLDYSTTRLLDYPTIRLLDYPTIRLPDYPTTQNTAQTRPGIYVHGRSASPLPL